MFLKIAYLVTTLKINNEKVGFGLGWLNSRMNSDMGSRVRMGTSVVTVETVDRVEKERVRGWMHWHLQRMHIAHDSTYSVSCLFVICFAITCFLLFPFVSFCLPVVEFSFVYQYYVTCEIFTLFFFFSLLWLLLAAFRMSSP